MGKIDEKVGLSTYQALGTLYDDIEKVVKEHGLNKNSRWQTARNVLSISNKFSTFNWASFLCALLVGIAFIFTSFFVDPITYGNLFGHGIFTIGLGSINVCLILWEDSLRKNEIHLRLNGLLQLIKECQERYTWTPDNYPHLCSPYSPCITLQWTYRDGRVVNLPWALLCRGDTIVLRPGQPAPGNCAQLEDSSCFLSCGEIYAPPAKHDHITMPTARIPFSNKRFILQETPILRNMREVLEKNTRENFSSFDNKRHSIMTTYIQFLGLPFLMCITLAVSFLQYGFVNQWVATGHWTVMFLLLPALISLPLLNLGFPATWIVLNTFGNAKLSAFLQSGVASDSDINYSNSADPFEDISIVDYQVQNIVGGVKWGQHFLHSLFGTQHSLTLTRSSNPLHVLGSVTALACVDKKGILSWPNPTAEKVFFLKTKSGKPSIARNNTAEQSVTDGMEDVLDEPPPPVHRKTSRQQEHYTAVEVLDLTHDLSCPFKLEFDDTRWQEHLSSLKPIGLAIVLNTCNMATQEHYVQFCSHVTCEAMYNEDLVPVTNRRCPTCIKELATMFSNNKCLCELSKQIGFTDSVKKNYKLMEQLSTFRHVQPDTVRKDIKFARSLALATKLKLPFPHMVAVVTSETHSPNSLQLFSQATGDIALDSCVDFWDGTTLRTLTSSDRKKMLDFYQRTSLTAYCTAFAYRPLGKSLNSKLSRIYMELPADSHHLYLKNRSPTPLDWDFHQSSDSLFGNESLEGEVKDIEGCFEIQCNQIFLGMVTMQYQAQIEMVQLIEQLERACIRFVHFSKENELRSRVFSEKMGLESGWNCHISLLSSDASTDDGIMEEEIELDDDKCNESVSAAAPLLVDNLCGSLEGSRTMSLSAPGAINSEKDYNDATKPMKTSEDEIDLGSQDGWQSLSCLTDSTEQSAPINFDMSNRAKLPRGIDQIRPHLEKVDNVPLLVSLFTDCTPSTTEEMIEIMQDYDEVVCVMGSSANADNNSIFLKANASVSVEPLYPQVCQNVPVFSASSDIISPVQLAQRLNSLPCSVSITKQRPISLFHLIMHARHFMRCLWNSVQFWICSVVSVSFLQVINTMILLPPLFTVGQIIWISCGVIPAISISLVNTPTNPLAMQRPGYKSKLKVNYEVVIFVLWCYGTKFLPSLLFVPFIYGASLNSHCVSLARHNATNASTCTLVYPYPNKPWGGWEEHSSPLVTSQMLAFTVFTVHLVMVSVSFVHREYLCWKRSPIRNRTWLSTVTCILVLQTLYPLMVGYLSPIDDDPTNQRYYLRTPWIAVVLAIVSPLIVFIVNEAVKWQEIRANLRYEKRARLDFGTKLGMNSPF